MSNQTICNAQITGSPQRRRRKQCIDCIQRPENKNLIDRSTVAGANVEKRGTLTMGGQNWGGLSAVGFSRKDIQKRIRGTRTVAVSGQLN